MVGIFAVDNTGLGGRRACCIRARATGSVCVIHE